MTPLPTVQLNKFIKPSHPWVLNRLIEKPQDRIAPGSAVDVVGPKGEWIARGFFNARARIGIRIMTTDPHEAIDAGFFQRRIDQAIALRLETLELQKNTSAMRLIHAEGDGLSGLVVDRYNDLLAIQYFSAGMFRHRELIHQALKNRFPAAHLYWFAEDRVQKQESFDCWEQPLPEPLVITENGVQFAVAVGSAHKTGFFTDQRENRQYLAQLTAGKKVLDLCTHTGGFAVYAKAKGGAQSVIAVDLDQDALKIAQENAALNQVEVDCQAADVFDWMRRAQERKERFDVVVLDPAKQTRRREEVDKALDQYVAMNRLAMDIVSPGGVLLSCSCSGLISEDEFLETIRRAGLHSGRTVQIFRITGAAADHPFHAAVPESRYLKAVWARIF